MILSLLTGLILAVSGQVHTCNGGTVNYTNITASDVTVVDCRVRDTGAGVNGVSVRGNRSVLRRVIVERYGASIGAITGTRLIVGC